MRNLRFLMSFLVVTLFALAGCGGGGGGGDDDGSVDIGGGTTSGGFTTELLDASPSFYYYNVEDDGVIEQESIRVTGSGSSYIIYWNSYEFNKITKELIFMDDGQELGVLQENGTLKFSDGGVLTLLEQTDTYIKVTGSDEFGPWTDTWYFSPPAGWITSGGNVPGATPFTKELLDTNPTLYFAVTDAGGTDQAIFKITGNDGIYTISANDYEFDLQGNLVESSEQIVTAVLQQDGTLLVNGVEVLTLLEETPAYIKVTGPDDVGQWTDTWYFNKPAGWIEPGSGSDGGTPPVIAFTAADFNDKTHYLLNDTGVAWETFTLATSINGSVMGADGLVNPMGTPDYNGTWTIDTQGRLYIVGVGGEETYYKLAARKEGFLETCWGATPAEADACDSPEIWYTDFTAASNKAAVYPPVQ